MQGATIAAGTCSSSRGLSLSSCGSGLASDDHHDDTHQRWAMEILSKDSKRQNHSKEQKIGTISSNIVQILSCPLLKNKTQMCCLSVCPDIFNWLKLAWPLPWALTCHWLAEQPKRRWWWESPKRQWRRRLSLQPRGKSANWWGACNTIIFKMLGIMDIHHQVVTWVVEHSYCAYVGQDSEPYGPIHAI